MTRQCETFRPATLAPAVDAGSLDAAGRTEGDLLARLRRNDAYAFEELVRAQSARLLSVARRILRNEEDARDAVQEGFVSAFRALPEFNGQSRLATWLHRIVVNASLMKLRARSRRPEVSIETLLPRFLEDGHHAEPVGPWMSVDAMLMRQETRAQLLRALDSLPDSYRTVVVLRDIEELDTETTAKMLGLTPNAVKIRLHRARQALVRLLSPAVQA
jgi:RNA polymerase sigma-70 factor (ECF subfamily)